jgi:hypothetical protein
MLAIRRTLAVTFTAAAFIAPPAFASPADLMGGAGESSTNGTVTDVRGEHAAALAASNPVAYGMIFADLRGEQAASAATSNAVTDGTQIADARGENAASAVATSSLPDGTVFADLRSENAASAPATSPVTDGTVFADVRGENAASAPATATIADGTQIADARGEHAVALASTEPLGTEPPTQPVVNVGEPIADGFDWTDAIIGLGAGLVLAALLGAGVAGGRRHYRPSIG